MRYETLCQTDRLHPGRRTAGAQRPSECIAVPAVCSAVLNGDDAVVAGGFPYQIRIYRQQPPRIRDRHRQTGFGELRGGR